MKYPIYAELRNLCDLALAASLVREEGLADKVGWHMAYFGDPQAFVVEQGAAPKEVDSVVNYRLLTNGVFVAQVSGGVIVKPNELVSRQGDPGRELSAASGEAAQQRRQTAGGRPLVVGLSLECAAGSMLACSSRFHFLMECGTGSMLAWSSRFHSGSDLSLHFGGPPRRKSSQPHGR